jgi:hypothetical protein
MPPPDFDHLSHADLKDLVLSLLEEVAELRRRQQRLNLRNHDVTSSFHIHRG